MAKPKKEGFYYTGRDGTGHEIKRFYCNNEKCGYTTNKAQYSDRDEENTEPASVQVTLGFYGPNGNGFTYFCRKCGHSMRFKTSYNAIKQFLG